MRRILLPLSVLLACFLAVAPGAAVAKSPPTGKYYCRFYEGRTYGALTVVSASKYKWHNGKRGRYSSAGRKIRFRSGPLKGVYKRAEWRRNGKTVWINLFDGPEYGRSYTDAQCIRSRSSS